MGAAAAATTATIHSAPVMGTPALLAAAALTIFIIHVSFSLCRKIRSG